LAAPVLLVFQACVTDVAGHPSGISLVGNLKTGAPPVLVFAAADPSAAVQVTAGGGSFQIARGDQAPSVTFSASTVQVPDLAIDGELSASSLSVAGIGQWMLWDLDTFDTEDSNRWSPNDHSFCGAPHDKFLGGHCRFGATTASRRYAELPMHSRVRIKARVHYLDQWDGESVLMMVNNEPVWAQSHSWCPGFLKWMCSKYGVDTCGRDTPDRLSVKVDAVLPHSGPTLDLSFSSNLAHGTDPCYTSWGVDDISLELL